MESLYLSNILNFNNGSLVYFYLSLLYLFGFSKYIKVYSNYNINKIDNKMIKIVNIFISFILLVLLFIRGVVPSLKLILLIITFIIYNKFIFLLDFQQSLLISTLYYFFCFISVKIFSIFFKPEMTSWSIKGIFLLVIYHVMVLTVFIMSMYVFLIPMMKNRVLSEIIYPLDRKTWILYIILIYNLISIPVLNLVFDCSPLIDNMFFVKIFFILEILYIFYITYFFNIRFIDRRINNENEKDILIDDLILSSSARYEDKKIKNMNESIRIYSSVMKTNINENENNYIYERVQNLLDNFYKNYHTPDDILNEIMSEKTMMCEELGIVFLSNLIKVDTLGIDETQRKFYYTILSLMIDIFVISLYNQKIEDKYIMVNIIKFGQGLSLQITHNYSLDKNIMYDKNKILRSDKYKYLDMIVRQNNGRIKINTCDNKMNLVVMCK